MTVAYCLRNMSESMELSTAVGDFRLGGPDVLEVDGLAVLVLAEGVVGEVVADVAGEGVGDDQRRAHEVVGADLGRYAAFEVAIAGEDGDGDEAVVFDGLRDVGRAAGRSCRCRWCSRSRRPGSGACRGRAGGRTSCSSR